MNLESGIGLYTERRNEIKYVIAVATIGAVLALSGCGSAVISNDDDNKNNSAHTYQLLNDKGTVFDKNTNKTWQNTQIDHGERDDATQHCLALDFAELSNWRLPSSEESGNFHRGMNAQGDVPKQAFERCTAEVTTDGYVRTKKGATQYGGNPGDPINFRGGANIRCVSDG